MALGKMLAKAAVKANKNAGGLAAAGAVAGAGGAAVKKNADAKKAKPAAKAAPKKFNSGGDVKGGLRSSTIMSNALQKRMEEAGVNEPVLTKAKAASAPETGQYNGKKFQMSAERKAKQEEERKRLMKKHFRNED